MGQDPAVFQLQGKRLRLTNLIREMLHFPLCGDCHISLTKLKYIYDSQQRAVNMRISIFGSGYVGLVQAAVFADVGHRVVCMDIDAERVERLIR